MLNHQLTQREIFLREKEPSRKPPDLHERIIYLMWEHPELDDPSFNPEWLGDSLWGTVMYGRLQRWRGLGKPQDPVLFDDFDETKGFVKVWENCRHFDIKKESFAEYLDQQKKLFAMDRVYRLKEDLSELDPGAALPDVRKVLGMIDALDAKPAQIWTARNYANEFIEVLEGRKANRDPELKTGFGRLDMALHGLHRGEVVTLGARTGRGKSVFMINVTASILNSGKRVLYFSTEMSVADKWGRLISIMTRIPAAKFRWGDFDRTEWDEIGKKANELYDNNNFIVCDQVSPTIEQVEQVVMRTKPDVVILDYLGLFTLPKEDRKDLQIGEFMKRVKAMARTHNCAVLVASQLNRQVDNRDKQIPNLSDLKESGSIEQESDIVILLHDDPDTSIDKKPTEDLRYMILNIEKNRHGAPGKIGLVFFVKQLRLEEVIEE